MSESKFTLKSLLDIQKKYKNISFMSNESSLIHIVPHGQTRKRGKIDVSESIVSWAEIEKYCSECKEVIINARALSLEWHLSSTEGEFVYSQFADTSSLNSKDVLSFFRWKHYYGSDPSKRNIINCSDHSLRNPNPWKLPYATLVMTYQIGNTSTDDSALSSIITRAGLGHMMVYREFHNDESQSLLFVNTHKRLPSDINMNALKLAGLIPAQLSMTANLNPDCIMDSLKGIQRILPRTFNNKELRVSV